MAHSEQKSNMRGSEVQVAHSKEFVMGTSNLERQINESGDLVIADRSVSEDRSAIIQMGDSILFSNHDQNSRSSHIMNQWNPNTQ